MSLIYLHKMEKFPFHNSNPYKIGYKDKEIDKATKILGLDKFCYDTIDDEIWKKYEDKFPLQYIFNYLYKDYDWESIFKIFNLDYKKFELCTMSFDNLDNSIYHFENIENSKIKRSFNEKDYWEYMIPKTCKAFLRRPSIGFIQNGTNEKYDSDGMYDTCTYVFDKKTLYEHMIKYFSDTQIFFNSKISCREYFKKNIYDKFEDNCGMVVLYC